MDSDLLKYRIAEHQANMLRHNLAITILIKMGEELTSNVRLSPESMFWAHATNRDDLQILMTLAPVWKKNADSGGIDYRAHVDGIEVTIKAEGDALPGTCKLVEEEYEIPERPAQPAVPATKGKRMVLKCDQPAHAEPSSTEPSLAETIQKVVLPDPAMATDIPFEVVEAAMGKVVAVDLDQKKAHCAGCKDDFYNHGGNSSTGRCWCLESAQLVMKKEVHVDQRPPWNQEAGLFLSCFKRPRHVYVQPHQTC